MKLRFFVLFSTVALGSAAANAQYTGYGPQPYCREFTQVVTVGGIVQPGYGTACMQPDGAWKIESPHIPENQPVQYIVERNEVMYMPPAHSYFNISFMSGGRDYGHNRHHYRSRSSGHGRGHGRHHR